MPVFVPKKIHLTMRRVKNPVQNSKAAKYEQKIIKDHPIEQEAK